MFRWGILSTAKIGREHVIPGIIQSDNGILYGIASRDLEKAEALATHFGARKAYGSYEAMLADPEWRTYLGKLNDSGYLLEQKTSIMIPAKFCPITR